MDPEGIPRIKGDTDMQQLHYDPISTRIKVCTRLRRNRG